MPSQVDILKAKVQSVKTILEKTSPSERENRVSTHLAQQFNELVTEISAVFPDLAAHLPKPIPSTTPHRRVGLSDVGYVDLLIMAEQVLSILSVAGSHG